MELKSKEKAKNKAIGALGEELASYYLTKLGFVVIDRNYLKKWGEIDIIAQKETNIHFIEVKTVSYETRTALEWTVAHETWRPEENVTALKIRKLNRTIETWLADKQWAGNWQIDVVSVRLVPRETYAVINIIDNIVLN